MKKILFIVLLFSIALNCPGTQTVSDSIRTKLLEVHGEAKLKLLQELYHQSNSSHSDSVLLELLLKESVRQKNNKMEMWVLAMQIQTLVNANRAEQVIIGAPKVIAQMRKNKEYKLMFTIQDLLIGQFMMSKRFADALRMTNEQLKEAKQLNNPLGLAIANKNMGMIYRSTGRSAEVWNFYTESLQWLKKANEKSMIIDLYLDMISINQECSESEKALENCNKCLRLIEENMRTETQYTEKNKLTAQFFTCLCIKACVYLELDKIKEAEKCITQAHSLVNPGWSGVWLFPLWEAEIEYNIKTQHFAQALKYTQLYSNCINPGQLALFLYLINKKATIYQGMGQFKQACQAYQKAAQIKDTLYNINFARQLDEIRSLHELDKLEMKAETDKMNLIVLCAGMVTLFVICILMGIIIFIVRRNSKRLEEKNRSLFLQLKEKDAMQAEINRLSATEKNAATELSPENNLFVKLQKWLEAQNRFTGLRLTPEEVAKELNTNTRYLYAAIRQSTGQTFNDYLNTLKLEYARKLILSEKNDQLTIEGISNEAGFNTRSNFYRLFRIRYGLTPSELRKQEEEIAKQNNENTI